MKDELFDIAIIGGGLAGLTLAIQCADKGYRTILFEKESYPFHKVCGEYISMESKPFLQGLGVPFDEWNLPVINKLVVSDAGGKTYDFTLPLGGFGISRYTLDNTLYQIALQRGVVIFTQTKVSDVKFEEWRFCIQSTAGIFYAKLAAGSYGKRSNLDIKWNRPFAQQKAGKLNNYIGIKYHIRYPQPADLIALHNFKNGYCGISAIEDGAYCLCYLTTAQNLQDNKNNIAAMEQQLLQQNPQLQKIFSEAVFLFQQPLAISQVSFAKKSQVEEHMLMVGDAAGMITPLCGNGMSMAMHGSKLAFEQVDSFLQGHASREEMETNYALAWKKQFSKRVSIGRMVQRLFGGNKSTALFFNIMHKVPALARIVIKSTHGQPF